MVWSCACLRVPRVSPPHRNKPGKKRKIAIKAEGGDTGARGGTEGARGYTGLRHIVVQLICHLCAHSADLNSIAAE